MKISAELENIDFTGTCMENNEYLKAILTESEFIDDTLDVLASDNIAYKKNYFIDNQEEVKSMLADLKALSSQMNPEILTEDYAEKMSDINMVTLNKIIGITIKRLESGINKFNKELQIDTNTVSSSANDIKITKESINDALQHNEGTIKINESLKNIRSNNNQDTDDYTKKMQQEFDSLMQQTKQPQRPVKGKKDKYAMVARNGNYYQIIEGNFTKEELNKQLLNSGLDRPRLYKLVEIPTVEKTVKKVVTIIQ